MTEAAVELEASIDEVFEWMCDVVAPRPRPKFDEVIARNEAVPFKPSDALQEMLNRDWLRQPDGGGVKLTSKGLSVGRSRGTLKG